MAVRWMAAAVVLVLATAVGAGAQTTPGVYGRALRITDGPDPAKRRIYVKVWNRKGLDAAAMDLATNGLFLHVYNSAGTSDSVCFSLPATGWTASGSGFRYRDLESANGPCRVAALRKGTTFKAVCTATRSPIDYTLDEPAQATVGVRIIAGPIVYCADFGGAERGDIPGKRFKGRNAFAPLTCRPAPAACPLSS